MAENKQDNPIEQNTTADSVPPIEAIQPAPTTPEELPKAPETPPVPEEKSKAGRPWFNGKDINTVLAKLEEAAAIDASVEECLYYADISKDSYYRYLEANPEFRERLEALRQKPFLKARRAINSALDDPNQAFRYMEKKRRKEFGNAVDITTGGESLNDYRSMTDEQLQAIIQRARGAGSGGGNSAERISETKSA